MSYSDSLDLLDGYNQWVATRKVEGVDTTPSTYLVERAKNEALQRVNTALEKLDELHQEYNGDDPTGDQFDAGVIHAEKLIRKILEDDDE